MKRRVEPEFLDALPEADPQAIRSRADLEWLNNFFQNPQWFLHQIKTLPAPVECLVEWGAGSGTLLQGLCSQLNPSLLPLGLDLCPAPPGWPGDWIQGDLLAAPAKPRFPGEGPVGILANLFLHHFEAPALERLGKSLDDPRISFLLVSEPWRHHVFWLGAQALTRIMQMGAVTRHDAPVSVRAGFQRGELASRLKLDPLKWMIHEETTLRGMIRLRALRR